MGFNGNIIGQSNMAMGNHLHSMELYIYITIYIYTAGKIIELLLVDFPANHVTDYQRVNQKQRWELKQPKLWRPFPWPSWACQTWFDAQTTWEWISSKRFQKPSCLAHFCQITVAYYTSPYRKKDERGNYIGYSSKCWSLSENSMYVKHVQAFTYSGPFKKMP